MSTLEHPTLTASTFKSVPDMWHHRTRSTPEGIGMYHRHPTRGWLPMTWREAGERVRDIANGLLDFDLQREQGCALLAPTSVEWVLADMAIVCAGGATTPLHPSSTAEECVYILNHSEAPILFCDSDVQVEKLLGVRGRLEHLRLVVVTHGTPTTDGWVVTLEQLEERGRAYATEHPTRYDEVSASVQSDDLATLIYTSGTTGLPKGVMLSHDAWVYESEAIDTLGIVSPADTQFLFLPLSHVFAKVLEIAFIRLGVPTLLDDDAQHVVEHLEATSPTWMGAVPRVFEKIHNRVIAAHRSRGRIAWRGFRWAVGVGQEVSRLRQDGADIPASLRLQMKVADRMVFAQLRKAFGGRVRFFISGGAPLSRTVAEFFHAADVVVLEGYGLTESCGASTLNTPDSFRFGTVGRPLPGCQVRIADDGEVLLRSRGVMKGYFRLPDETAAVLSDDGFLRTGDLGTVLHSGHLKLTGRKKDIIITSAGKNIAPEHYQGLLKSICPYVEHVLVHGDNRPYCVALIALNPELSGRWADERGLIWKSYADLASLPELRELVGAAVRKVNAELASHESVKRFHICTVPWTIDNGVLTPTLKVRRRLVEERWAAAIDELYGTPPAA